MGNPVRYTAGFTQDFAFQPLGQCGFPDPFFYAVMADDFLPYTAGNYVVTAAGGSVAASTTSGSGGRILFTTGAVATNFASIQSAANFVVATPKKLAAVTRIQLADVTNSAVIFGFLNAGATPFSPTDGIYITKASGANVWTLNVLASSASRGSVTIPFTPAVNTDFDLGIFTDRLGNTWAYAGPHMVGAQTNQNASTLGPQTGILAANLSGAMPTAVLGPALGVEAGTAAAQTMVADFLLGAEER